MVTQRRGAEMARTRTAGKPENVCKYNTTVKGWKERARRTEEKEKRRKAEREKSREGEKEEKWKRRKAEMEKKSGKREKQKRRK